MQTLGEERHGGHAGARVAERGDTRSYEESHFGRDAGRRGAHCATLRNRTG
jgi:hypothetical protein